MTTALYLLTLVAAPALVSQGPTVVNDLHAQLNAVHVAAVREPKSVQDLQAIVKEAQEKKLAISISGGRHAMGGQQFGEGTLLIDMRSMARVLHFDRAAARVQVEAGIAWPALIDYLLAAQRDDKQPVSIRQKQTGADRLTLGGALSCNAHGRGLTFKPIVDDVESFRLVDAQGKLLNCSRTENKELFDLVIGGYGLFGVISDVTLRLFPRLKLERVVEVTEVAQVNDKMAQRIEAGYLYGDFQYSIDPNGADFLNKGVLSAYRPLPADSVMPASIKELSAQDWGGLYLLAHTSKAKAFEVYSHYYLGTTGQKYWSDTHQLGIYVDNYHKALDQQLHSPTPGSEMITELYVPRAALATFMRQAAAKLRSNGGNVIYGTVRYIKKDDETFLAWARQDYAAVIFNLHVDHAPDAIERVAGQFRDLIDLALALDGSYYLTYHRWATPQQVLKAYPQFIDFLKQKRTHDPQERFVSEWYRHYKQMFAAQLKS